MVLIGVFVLLNIILIIRATFAKIQRKKHLKRVIKIKQERYKRNGLMVLSSEIKMKIAQQRNAKLEVKKEFNFDVFYERGEPFGANVL